MTKYYDQWFNLKLDGLVVRAKCIDIEFETGFGPRLLMQTRDDRKFWLSREDLREFKV